MASLSDETATLARTLPREEFVRDNHLEEDPDLVAIADGVRQALEDPGLKYDPDLNTVGLVVTHESPGPARHFKDAAGASRRDAGGSPDDVTTITPHFVGTGLYDQRGDDQGGKKPRRPGQPGRKRTAETPRTQHNALPLWAATLPFLTGSRDGQADSVLWPPPSGLHPDSRTHTRSREDLPP